MKKLEGTQGITTPSWRDNILKEFAPHVIRLTLVSDPDCLLTEEKLSMELRRRGFDLIEFNDPIEFRYAYESKYRSIWDRGEHTDLVVILRLQNAELESLPYDLLQAGRRLSFNLGELFPNMSYPIVEQLDRSLFDLLFDAQKKTSPDRMGDDATRDFILRHVFGVTAELLSTEVELLHFLLRAHYGNMDIPATLTERLIEVLKNSGNFEGWALAKIVPDAEYFFTFIQERWPIFLENLSQADRIKEDLPIYGLKIEGPVRLPFDHQDIRVYIDNLFFEGKLTPVDFPDNTVIEKDSWILSGVSASGTNSDNIRISRLFELVKNAQPSMDSRHTDWILFALKWAELSALIHSKNSDRHKNRYNEISGRMNELFADWLETHYASLMNLPPSKPAMLHHVARCLAQHVESRNSRPVALVVVDGLSLEQWVTVRSIIQTQSSNFILREYATFAWIPTLTSVSRQSIFAGKAPFYFPSSIGTTGKEEELWKQFWEGHGISKPDVIYQRGLGDGEPGTRMDSVINPSQTRIVGLVIDKIDKIMHGMQLGAAGMHNQINLWCRDKYLITLLNYLNEHGYDIWLTSDHGNVESTGRGRLLEGGIAESRGTRARVYPNPELRSQIASSHSFAREWQPLGLPKNYFPLVATGADAFVKEGELIVGHGGIALEEVIVPLIKIERKHNNV